MEVVNAGHVAPYLFRGSAFVPLDLRIDLPFGMFADTTYGSTRVDLEPGDRLVLVTDGMLERNVASVDIRGTITASGELHPRELVRALADSALAAAGQALEDDATVLCLDWHGTHDDSRASAQGADPARATSCPSGP
jgi:serine phosphatase RsbU (regulator of sigma subunit)